MTPYCFRNKTVSKIETIAPIKVETNCMIFFLSDENIEPRKPANAPRNTDIKRYGVTHQ